MTLHNHEVLRAKYHDLEIQYDKQKDKNYKTEYENLKEKHTKIIEEKDECMKSNTVLEKLLNEAKIESTSGKCQKIKARLIQIREKYRSLVDVNRECIKTNAKMKQTKTTDKETDQKCQEIRAKLDKMTKENLTLSKKVAEDRKKWIGMRYEHEKCKTLLQKLKGKDKISSKRSKAWEIEAMVKDTFTIVDEESQKFQTMIERKLDFVVERHSTEKNDRKL